MDKMRKLVLLGLIVFSVGTLQSYNSLTFLWQCAVHCKQQFISFLINKKKRRPPEFKVDVCQTEDSFEHQKYHIINNDHGCYGLVRVITQASLALEEKKFREFKKDTEVFYHTVLKNINAARLIDVGATASNFIARRLPVHFEDELQKEELRAKEKQPPPSMFLLIKRYLLSFLRKQSSTDFSTRLVPQAFENAYQKVAREWQLYLKRLQPYEEEGFSDVWMKHLPNSYILVKPYNDRLWYMQAGPASIIVKNNHKDIFHSADVVLKQPAANRENSLLPYDLDSIPLQEVHTIAIQYPSLTSPLTSSPGIYNHPECAMKLVIERP